MNWSFKNKKDFMFASAHRNQMASSRNISLLLAFVYLTVCTYSAGAQEFSLGLKAGPLLSRSVIADKSDRKDFSQRNKLGYMGAALIIFPLKNNYSFETEVGFSQRGRKILSNEDTWTNSATYYFVDASMMLRRSFPLKIRENLPTRWFVNLGPNISYWLGGRGKIGVNQFQSYDVVFGPMPDQPSGPEPDFDKMYLTDVNRWLFGVNIGVGFIAPLHRSQKVLTELRFTSGHTFYGRTTSASWRTLGFADNLRSNEKFLSLTVAYIFDFNLKEGRKGKSTKDKEVHRKPTKTRH
jgi:hypothetical protein